MEEQISLRDLKPVWERDEWVDGIERERRSRTGQPMIVRK